MEKIVIKDEDGNIILKINRENYEKAAILATSYKFTDKAYIFINPMSESIVGVSFKAKEDCKESLSCIVDKFCNELIDEQLRLEVEKEYKDIRNELVKKAFSSIQK